MPDANTPLTQAGMPVPQPTVGGDGVEVWHGGRRAGAHHDSVVAMGGGGVDESHSVGPVAKVPPVAAVVSGGVEGLHGTAAEAPPIAVAMSGGVVDESHGVGPAAKVPPVAAVVSGGVEGLHGTAAKAPPIAVAMSGGVDSSTVAALLVREGRSVVGLTMQLWNQRRLPELATEGATGRCCSLDDVYDARRVAEQIGIPYYVVNFERQFEAQVVKPFVAEYLAGRTPVPCTLCNNYIKFDRFLEMADAVGAHHIATGHYARVRYDEASGRYQLLRAVDGSKDQTYFLFGLTQQQLARTLFPLGGLTKPEVRDMAHSMDLAVAAKGDSQEICFVPNGDYAAFLDAYLKDAGATPQDTHGAIVSSDGRTLGEHQGVHHFTVGQRRGLGIATGEPLYVIATDPASQRVIVGGSDELLRPRFFVNGVNWISIAGVMEPVHAQVKIRNKHAAAAAMLHATDDAARVEVVFDEPQRAVTPGQGAVFYDGDLILGGGWIE